MSTPQANLDWIRIRFQTFRTDSAEDREAFATEARKTEAAEHVVVATCHRVELVSVEEPRQPDDRSVSGAAAVERLFRVVAGFDSAVVAEEQLLGQVRAAYEAALANGSTGPILNELFRRSLRFGRRVRSHARPGTDRSLADRGVAWLEERLRSEAAGKAVHSVVVGSGEMARLMAERLAQRSHRVTVVSQSAERGRRVVEHLTGAEHGVHVGATDDELLTSADAIAVASRRPMTPGARKALERSRPWTLDLSLPSAIGSDTAAALGDRAMTLDALGAVGSTKPVFDPATQLRLEREVHNEVERFSTWLGGRRGVPAVEVLRAGADAVRRGHLARLTRRASLDAAQLAAVEAATAAMVGELLHGPSVELRRNGVDAATVRRIFGLER